MAKSDGSVIIDTRMNTSGFQTGVADMKKGFGGIGKSLGKIAKVMVGVFAAKQLVQFGKEAIELGSDLSEVQNVVDVTFENLNEEINEFAKNALEQFGLSETAAKQYTSTMGAMLKSMGFTTREAADMGKTMTGLAADMASFYNLNAEDAFYKIRAGISGETEPLKQLGINLNVANLEAYALSQGITKSYNAMTQQEQTLLRYNYLLKVTADAQGDFSRTSDSWANQTRILSERFKALKATIGQGLINLFTPVIRVINTLLGKLATVANAFKSFTELITGKKSSGQTTASGAGLANAGLVDMGDGYDSAAEGAENYADATKDAADATKDAEKETSRYLSGLDEIHRFESPDVDTETGSGSGNGGGGGTAGGLAGAVENVDYGNLAEGETVLEKTSGLFDKIIQKIKELGGLFKQGFFDGLGDYKPVLEGMRTDFDSIKESLKNIFTSPDVVNASNNFFRTWAYSLGQIAGSLSSVGLSIGSNIVGGFEKYLAENNGRIKGYMVSMFDIGSEIGTIAGNFSQALAEIFSVIGGETGQQITANILTILSEVGMTVSETALKIGRDIFDMLTKPIIENKKGLEDALEGTLKAIEPFTAGLKSLVKDVSSEIKKLYDKHLKPFFDSFSEGISDLLRVLLDGYNQYLAPTLQRIGAKFQEVMEGPVGDAIESASTTIGKLVDAVKMLWDKVLSPFISWIASAIMPVISPIIEYVGGVVLNTVETISRFIKDIFDLLGGLIDFVTGIFTLNWRQAWTGIKEIFSSIWDGMKNILKLPVNAIIRLINGLLSGMCSVVNGISKMLNSLSITIPDWVPGFGGKKIGFNLPTWRITPVPYLAQGAVIPPNAPFTAVLGDQKRGNNIEAPESLIRKIVREESSKNNGGFSGTIRIPVIFDGRQVFEAVITEAKMKQLVSGRNPFEMG